MQHWKACGGRQEAGGQSQSLDDISSSLRVAASGPLAIHRHLSGGQRSWTRPCDQHWIGLRGKAVVRSQSLDDISPSLRVAASSPLAIYRHLSGGQRSHANAATVSKYGCEEIACVALGRRSGKVVSKHRQSQTKYANLRLAREGRRPVTESR